MLRISIMKNKRLFNNFYRRFTSCSTTTKLGLKQNKNDTKLVRLGPPEIQSWIFNYFQKYYVPSTTTEIKPKITFKSSDYNDLQKCNNTDLAQLIFYSNEYFQKKHEFRAYIKGLDKECCTRLAQLKINEIFEILFQFMRVIPQRITFLSFYTQAVHKMNFILDFCTRLELVQICFYVGLQKKTRESQIILKNCLLKFNSKYMNEITIPDLIIICNSTYKASVRIEHKRIIDKIEFIINNNLNLLNDASSFLIFVKSIRQNQYKNEELLTTISHTIFFNNIISNYNFTGCSHLLALYADALHYDFKLLNLFVTECVEYLKNSDTILSNREHFSRQIRVKDIARFLWAVSYIGFEYLEEKIIRNHIETVLKEFISIGDLSVNTEHFIDSALSMWILGYRPTPQLMSSIITKKISTLIHGKGKKRFVARFNLLLTIIKWEDNETYKLLGVTCTNPEPSTGPYSMRNRPYLKRTHDALCKIASKLNLKKFEYTSPVPYLNIIGLTGYDINNNVTIYVEVLDEILKLKNIESKPHGLMKLKLRLLKRLKKPILIVSKEDIEEMSQAELEKYLEKKLKKLI